MKVSFTPMTESEAIAIWQTSRSDIAWPMLHRNRDSFLRFVEEYETSALFQEGCMECIWVEGELAGYHILHRVSGALIEEELTCVECGTWLVHAYRGRGVNRIVKSRAISLVAKVFHAKYCMYAIPAQNERALRALQKLPLRWTIYRRGESQTFERLIRRKQWESGQPVVLFVLDVLSSETAETCRLLNPACNEGHSIEDKKEPHDHHQPSPDS